jgi:hypothetical protein
VPLSHVTKCDALFSGNTLIKRESVCNSAWNGNIENEDLADGPGTVPEYSIAAFIMIPGAV